MAFHRLNPIATRISFELSGRMAVAVPFAGCTIERRPNARLDPLGGPEVTSQAAYAAVAACLLDRRLRSSFQSAASSLPIVGGRLVAPAGLPAIIAPYGSPVDVARAVTSWAWLVRQCLVDDPDADADPADMLANLLEIDDDELRTWLPPHPSKIVEAACDCDQCAIFANVPAIGPNWTTDDLFDLAGELLTFRAARVVVLADVSVLACRAFRPASWHVSTPTGESVVRLDRQGLAHRLIGTPMVCTAGPSYVAVA
jgi:hypothetical protein